MKKFTKIITLAALAFLFVGCVQKEEVKRAPTMEEILALIPKDKQVYIIETPKNYPSNP